MRAPDGRGRWLLVFVLACELLAFAPSLAQRGVLRAPAAKASDGTGEFLIWNVFWRDEIAGGRAPLWNPYIYAGIPSAGEPQMQTFYPGKALWLFLDTAAAFKLTLVLHVLLGSALMYGLARQVGATAPGAAVAALVYGMHAQMLTYCFAGWMHIIAPMAWAPGVLWMIARAIRADRIDARACAIGGAMLGAQMLSGHPEWTRYTLLIGGLFVIFSRQAMLQRRVKAGAAIVGLGLLVGALQLAPAVEAASRSSRGQTAMRGATNLHGAALPAAALPIIIVPRLFGPWDLQVSVDGFLHKSRGLPISWNESLLYVGLAPLGLACVAAWRRRRDAAPWIAVTLTGIVFALNDLTHAQCVLDWLVPLDAVFRSPGRFVYVSNLGLAVLAGLGMSHLQRDRDSGRWLARAGVVLAAVLAGAAAGVFALGGRIALPMAERYPGADALAARMAVGDGSIAAAVSWAVSNMAGQLALAAIVAIASALVLSWFLRAPGTERAAAVILVIALDLGIVAWPFLTSVVPLDRVYGADTALLAPLGGVPGARFYAPDQDVLQGGPNVGMLSRVRSLAGYDVFSLPEWERLARAASTRDPDVLGAMGVTHLLAKDGDGVLGLTDIPGARGRAWWTDRVVLAADADRAAAFLTAGGAGGAGAIALEAALGEPIAPVAAPGSPQAAVQIDVDEPGRFEARVNAPAAGWLVFTEVFYPGWRARVNEGAVDVRRAFGAIQAVPVPAGESRVAFDYRPGTVRWGAMATALGLILAGWVLMRASPVQLPRLTE
jgi:hypothetical protein